MDIKNDLNKLKTEDIYSIMMFVLFKINETNEYSAISQLSYILDKESLLKLCEFYGGLTIKIPTISELELVYTALLMFQKVDIERLSEQEFLSSVQYVGKKQHKLISTYHELKEILKDFEFNS